MQFEESQTQSLIDSKIMEFEAKTRNAFQAQVLKETSSSERDHHVPQSDDLIGLHKSQQNNSFIANEAKTMPRHSKRPRNITVVLGCILSVLLRFCNVLGCACQVAASFQAQMMGRGAGPMPGAPGGMAPPGMPPRPMGPPMMGMPPPGRPPMGAPPHGFPGKSSALPFPCMTGHGGTCLTVTTADALSYLLCQGKVYILVLRKSLEVDV